MAAEPVAVEAEGLVRRFGPVLALDGLSLRIPAGCTFGLVGPNGAGKTTLIRLVMGIDRAQKGEVRVLGHPMPDPAVAPWLGYMPQSESLYLELTAREHLEFFGRVYGLRGPRLRARVEEMLALVGLERDADRLVEALSGGMRRRLSLAVALIHEPRLLMLDEPTVGVDPELRRTFWDHFTALAARGATVVVSTHHLDEARRCHRLAFVRGGRLLCEGTPEELLRQAGTADMEEAFLFFASGRTGGQPVAGGGSRP